MRPEDCLQHGMQLTFFVAGDVRSIMLSPAFTTCPFWTEAIAEGTNRRLLDTVE